MPIITKKGGLPETSKSALILKSLNSKNLFTVIEKLILDKNYLLKLQKENYKNFRFTPNFITKKIEKIRHDLISIKKINRTSSLSKLKILHITNFNERHNRQTSL